MFNYCDHVCQYRFCACPKIREMLYEKARDYIKERLQVSTTMHGIAAEMKLTVDKVERLLDTPFSDLGGSHCPSIEVVEALNFTLTRISNMSKAGMSEEDLSRFFKVPLSQMHQAVKMAEIDRRLSGM